MKEFLVTIFALQTVLTASGKEAQYEPAGLRIPTEWASKITPENAWREYPRPTLVRPQWQCLNGLWNYRVTPATETSRSDSWKGNPDSLRDRIPPLRRQRLTPQPWPRSIEKRGSGGIRETARRTKKW